jgi:hypothetical protein
MAVQQLASQLPLYIPNNATRYEEKNIMKYIEQGRDGEPDKEKKEEAGAIHLAHGWTQRGQKKKVSRKIIII